MLLLLALHWVYDLVLGGHALESDVAVYAGALFDQNYLVFKLFGRC